MTLTKSVIVAKFNSIVRDSLNSPSPSQAPWFQGHVPGVGDVFGTPSGHAQAEIQSHFQLGNRNEPGKSVSDVPGAAAMASTVFNVLHGFAMELTRVRRARYVYYYNSQAVYSTNTAALIPAMSLYFPIPGGQREPGVVITEADIDNFLVSLRNAVQDIRTNDYYIHTLTATCHTNAPPPPPPCHGSRGRR